ncbi:MAG: CRISPR-associated RAMP protein [Methanobacteriota archaeon]|nr:MAG: CRISPR-associated RAMP protein [Euryarchaeota archaeon]
MFKRLINECIIDLTIRPEGALLIKSGLAQVSGVDMAWVTVSRNGNLEPFLPGSSLKGTIRSHAERIARTFQEIAACNTVGGKDDKYRSCGTALNEMKEELKKEKKRNESDDLNTPKVYQLSCPICRLFGNTFLMGRFATEDAYAEGNPPQPEHRDGVGIDRFTGGAARGAKFEMEVITGGKFKTALHLQNFELWQLGLIGFVLRDMCDGLVRMGSGKSRGMGKVVAEINRITLHYVGQQQKMAQNGRLTLAGVGALFPQAREYGMVEEDRLEIENANVEVFETPLRQQLVFRYEDFPWEQVAKKWVTFVSNWKEDPLAKYRKGKGE